MTSHRFCGISLILTCLLGFFAAQAMAADPPTAKQALALRPIQEDVEYDKPTAAETEQCTVKSERSGRASAWVVRNSAGQLLRRFADTNADNKVDLWCYYKSGIEVYRDIDANFNQKADQYRWVGTGGTRWGLDENEDGRIDRWKQISAEEVTAEAVAALRTANTERFRTLLITPAELSSLKLSPDKSRQVTDKIAARPSAFSETVKRDGRLPDNATWIHFGGAMPGIVPAGTDGSGLDVTVYENVVAVIETGGKHGQVFVGTLIKAGGNWRLIDVPQVLAADESPAGIGFFFATPGPRTDMANITPAASDEAGRKAMQDLEDIDQELARTTSPAQQAKLHAKRADLLDTLIGLTSRPEERAVWIRQYADTVSAAAQSGAYPDGAKRLEKLVGSFEKEGLDTDLVAFVLYRSLEADYSVSLQATDADYGKIQEKWLKDLESFVKAHASSVESAEAMIHLALADEFSSKEDLAMARYGKIVKAFPDSPQAKKAAGALRRLDCVGKAIPLRGATLSGSEFDLSRSRGKYTVVHYWATWCEPCKRDMKTLQTLLQKYGARSLAVVGVNLDANQKDAVAYLQQNRLAWPQLFEQGGLQSRHAVEMGILTLPVMLLIDPQGKVVNRNLHITQVEEELKKRLR